MRLTQTVYQHGDFAIQLADTDRERFLVVRMRQPYRGDGAAVVRHPNPIVLDVVDQYQDGAIDIYVLEIGADHTLDDVLARHGERVGRVAAGRCPGCNSGLESALTEAGFQFLCRSCGGMFDAAALSARAKKINASLLGAPLPIDVAVEAAATVAETLAALEPLEHDRWLSGLNNMVHFTASGDVRFVNTTFAQRIGGPSLDDPTAPIGNLVSRFRYMSPEMARGRETTSASLTYTAALLAYELSTGRHAFEPWSLVFEFVQAAMRGEFPPPDQVVPSCPAAISEAITNGLAKEPHSRPPVGEFAAALRQAAGDSGLPLSRQRVADYLVALGPAIEPYPRWPLAFF